MAKFADHIEKIADGVTEGYKKIEDGVVTGYKKIETGAVEGFGKVVDKCVEVLFAKEGEEIWFGVADLGSSGDLASGHPSHVNAPVFLFDDLAQATACAASSGYSYIVLLNGGVLPAGSYTIRAHLPVISE